MSAENGDRVLLIRDVVRDVITDIAPDELPFVDRLRQLDDERVVNGIQDGNDELFNGSMSKGLSARAAYDALVARLNALDVLGEDR
ncbi:hypothetical protein [Nocardia flavorosea]|uniref:Uncharacterized protein n=1 Tax=Nocardia flavorosea TaxID=53429 RepID=A0A846YIV4_9NOCA|nr:hypothetical protein [Nocardia flavorosea]NKY59037.1 hypothetical protein [Nocardia flavorosea]